MEVIKSGNLIKSPPGISRVDDNAWPRKWENRYFELVKYDSGEFAWNYFQNETKERVKKSIEMKDVLQVVDNVQSKIHKNVFCVVTTNRKYFFSAPSATASTNWQLALLNSCPHLMEEEGTSSAINRRNSKWMPTNFVRAEGPSVDADGDSEDDADYDTYEPTTYLTKNPQYSTSGVVKSSHDSAENTSSRDYDTVSTSSGGRNSSAGSATAIVLPPQYEDMSGVNTPAAAPPVAPTSSAAMYEAMHPASSAPVVHAYQNVADATPLK
eukprot:m.778841 g.778841  ORF g.778841 m.778841 type:complete len:268 (-) comp23273_c0_seq12:538-1341(-)